MVEDQSENKIIQVHQKSKVVLQRPGYAACSKTIKFATEQLSRGDRIDFMPSLECFRNCLMLRSAVATAGATRIAAINHLHGLRDGHTHGSGAWLLLPDVPARAGEGPSPENSGEALLSRRGPERARGGGTCPPGPSIRPASAPPAPPSPPPPRPPPPPSLLPPPSLSAQPPPCRATSSSRPRHVLATFPSRLRHVRVTSP